MPPIIDDACGGSTKTYTCFASSVWRTKSRYTRNFSLKLPVTSEFRLVNWERRGRGEIAHFINRNGDHTGCCFPGPRYFSWLYMYPLGKSIWLAFMGEWTIFCCTLSIGPLKSVPKMRKFYLHIVSFVVENDKCSVDGRRHACFLSLHTRPVNLVDQPSC